MKKRSRKRADVRFFWAKQNIAQRDAVAARKIRQIQAGKLGGAARQEEDNNG